MPDRIKVRYETFGGLWSYATVDEDSGVGFDNFTLEDVTVELDSVLGEWVEVDE